MKTKEDWLICLVEECGEVIQAATKCLRYTWDYDYPGYGINHEVLAKEIGDLLGIIEVLPLDKKIMDEYKQNKISKVEIWDAEWNASKNSNG